MTDHAIAIAALKRRIRQSKVQMDEAAAEAAEFRRRLADAEGTIARCTKDIAELSVTIAALGGDPRGALDQAAA